MTVQEMKRRKQELGLSNEEISLRSGVPVGTLQKIFSGKTRVPRRGTIEALEKVLAPQQYSYDLDGDKPTYTLAESVAAYNAKPKKKQGEYTVDDYMALPDDKRYELIDGVIYDMAAPTLAHQTILGELHVQFRACAEAHGGNCTVFLSPCDVRLDNDNKTMLQPDLFVSCRKPDYTQRDFGGAPDLTVEILSPSSRSRDMVLKLNKYHHAGVREYWIVDPENKEIYVYDFTRNDFKPETYTFMSKIPIHISDNTCSIDFADISRRLGLL